jgi:hypothetical protein
MKGGDILMRGTRFRAYQRPGRIRRVFSFVSQFTYKGESFKKSVTHYAV